MRRTGVYLFALMAVVVGTWIVLVQTQVTPMVPTTVGASFLLVTLGAGIMGLARRTGANDDAPGPQRQVADDG